MIGRMTFNLRVHDVDTTFNVLCFLFAPLPTLLCMCSCFANFDLFLQTSHLYLAQASLSLVDSSAFYVSVTL